MRSAGRGTVTADAPLAPNEVLIDALTRAESPDDDEAPVQVAAVVLMDAAGRITVSHSGCPTAQIALMARALNIVADGRVIDESMEWIDCDPDPGEPAG